MHRVHLTEFAISDGLKLLIFHGEILVFVSAFGTDVILRDLQRNNSRSLLSEVVFFALQVLSPDFKRAEFGPFFLKNLGFIQIGRPLGVGRVTLVAFVQAVHARGE